MLKQITKSEYDETVKYYKLVKRLPHPLMVKSFNNGNYYYIKYDMLTDDVKVILNDYKKAR